MQPLIGTRHYHPAFSPLSTLPVLTSFFTRLTLPVHISFGEVEWVMNPRCDYGECIKIVFIAIKQTQANRQLVNTVKLAVHHWYLELWQIRLQ